MNNKKSRTFQEKYGNSTVDFIGNCVYLTEKDRLGNVINIKHFISKRDAFTVCLGFIQSKMGNCTQEQYDLLMQMREEAEEQRKAFDLCESV